MIDRADTAGCCGKGYSGGGLSYTLTKLDRHAVATIENMKPELPEIVGTLSDGAHMGGGLTGKTLTRDESSPQIAWALQERDAKGPDSSTKGGHLIPTHPEGFFSCAVRRLTPRECERLQGFSDDYTLTPYRGKPASDGPRYKALGNSMAVPVMKWIGERITKIDSIKTK